MAEGIEFITGIVPADQNSLDGRLQLSHDTSLIELRSNDQFYLDVPEKVRDVYDIYLAEQQKIMSWYRERRGVHKPLTNFQAMHMVFWPISAQSVTLLGISSARYFLGDTIAADNAILWIACCGSILASIGLWFGDMIGEIQEKNYLARKKERLITALNQKYIPLLMEAQNDKS